MTAGEIQRRIGYLQGQIDALHQENITLAGAIEALTEKGVDTTSLIGKIEKLLADCLGIVNMHLEITKPHSDCNAPFLCNIKAILSSKEVTEIGYCLGVIKVDTQNRIEWVEEKIKANNAQIYQFQKEIDELEAIQTICPRMNIKSPGELYELRIQRKQHSN